MTDSGTPGSVYQWTIMGTPTPKGRPRMTRTGRSYTPAKTKRAERAVRILSAAYAPSAPLSGRLSVDLAFFFEPAKSWSKKKRAAALAGELAHVTRPDIDNLIKLALDSLNGLAWIDDTQIDEIRATKGYSDRARTRFRITTTTKKKGTA